MKRRIFVRNLAVAGAGVGIAGIHACTPSTTKSETASNDLAPSVLAPFFSLSLAQWSIHHMIQKEGMDPYRFAELAKKWGFEAVEFVNQLYISKAESMGGGSDFSSKLNGIISELKKRSTDHGITNAVMMIDLEDGPGDLAVTDEVRRKKAVEAHYRWIDATAELGCPSARINMFGDVDPENWKATAVQSLGELGEYASKSGVLVLVENHGWLSSNCALLAEVMRQVNHPNIGTLPDFGNYCIKRPEDSRWDGCLEEYDPYKGMAEIMPFARAVSAKSYAFDNEGNETTIDFKRMLQIVKDAEYSGYISVEYEYKEGRLPEEDGIAATKALLEKLGSQLA